MYSPLEFVISFTICAWNPLDNKSQSSSIGTSTGKISSPWLSSIQFGTRLHFDCSPASLAWRFHTRPCFCSWSPDYLRYPLDFFGTTLALGSSSLPHSIMVTLPLDLERFPAISLLISTSGFSSSLSSVISSIFNIPTCLVVLSPYLHQPSQHFQILLLQKPLSPTKPRLNGQTVPDTGHLPLHFYLLTEMLA